MYFLKVYMFTFTCYSRSHIALPVILQSQQAQNDMFTQIKNSLFVGNASLKLVISFET
jgi:hypothetical protein